MFFDIYEDLGISGHRYFIGNSGANEIIVLGSFPSTATAFESDQTTTCAKRIAEHNFFDGFILVNIYPVRLSYFDGNLDRHTGESNIEQIKRVLADHPMCKKIWACWGNKINEIDGLRDYLRELYRQIGGNDFEWLHFGGITKSGNPRTAIGNGYSNEFSRLDIENYLRI